MRAPKERAGGSADPDQASTHEGGIDRRRLAMMKRAQERKKQGPPEQDRDAIHATAIAASQIVAKARGGGDGGNPMMGTPPEAQPALITLGTAMAVKDPDQRFRLLDSALKTLEPILRAGTEIEGDEVRTESQGVLYELEQLKKDANDYNRATERVDKSILVEGKHGMDVVETKDLEGEMDAEKSEKVRELVPKVRDDAKKILEGVGEGLLKNDPLKAKLESTLPLLDIYGAMADTPELIEKAGASENGLEQARLSAEIASKMLEAVRGTMTLGLQLGERIAKSMFKHELAESFAHGAEALGKGFGPLLTGLGLLKDVLTLIPGGGSSTQEKVDAAVDIGSFAASKIGGHVAGSAAEEAAAEDGVGEAGAKVAGDLAEKAVGGAIAGSLLINYEGLKLFAASWMNTRMTFAEIGYREGMQSVMSGMAAIGDALERMEKATLLAEQEKDPESKELLEAQVRLERNDLSNFIDQFLADIEDPKTSGHPEIQRQLQGLLALKSRTKPDGDFAAMRMIEQRVKWIIDHAADIITDEAERSSDDP
jgi:hypothetical protein